MSTRTSKPTDDYTNYLLGEFRWLDSKIKEERGSNGEYDNHYTDVKDRVVHKGLEPLFRNADKDNTALALCAMMSAESNNYIMSLSKNPTDSYRNNYNVMYGPWDEYFCKMDSLTADRLADYYQYISSVHKNAFETYCTQNTFHNSDYFNDLIGTAHQRLLLTTTIRQATMVWQAEGDRGLRACGCQPQRQARLLP